MRFLFWKHSQFHLCLDVLNAYEMVCHLHLVMYWTKRGTILLQWLWPLSFEARTKHNFSFTITTSTFLMHMLQRLTFHASAYERELIAPLSQYTFKCKKSWYSGYNIDEMLSMKVQFCFLHFNLMHEQINIFSLMQLSCTFFLITCKDLWKGQTGHWVLGYTSTYQCKISLISIWTVYKGWWGHWLTVFTVCGQTIVDHTLENRSFYFSIEYLFTLLEISPAIFTWIQLPLSPHACIETWVSLSNSASSKTTNSAIQQLF